MIGLVFDVSALRLWGEQASRYLEALVWARATHTGHLAPLIIPTPALVAALAGIRPPARAVLDVLLGLDIHIAEPLTPAIAPAIADLMRAARTSAPEAVTAAAVVHAAKSRNLPVCTTNPYPLQALWPDIVIDLIP
ncbi:hypothetical protein GCM10022252_76140 [Streptosporangium oxazolinicum]|uniref:PIN domain-containing protein n=1 Tax=Streptosporangium oxazolinicum TaxID=909287 RepID=A0ABP8BL12_9ACTN